MSTYSVKVDKFLIIYPKKFFRPWHIKEILKLKKIHKGPVFIYRPSWEEFHPWLEIFAVCLGKTFLVDSNSQRPWTPSHFLKRLFKRVCNSTKKIFLIILLWLATPFAFCKKFILHTGQNIAGQPKKLATWQRIYSIPATVFFGKANLKYIKLLLKAKVVWFHFGKSPLDFLELPWLKFTGKKIVFHFRGCEIRNPEKAGQMCRNCRLPVCSKKTRENLLRISKNHIKVVSTLDLLQHVPDSKWLPNLPDPFVLKVPKQNLKHRYFTHFPTEPGRKGTDTLKYLFKKEIKAIWGISKKEVNCEIENSAGVIDQVLSGAFGNTTVEALQNLRPSYIALGKKIIRIFPQKIGSFLYHAVQANIKFSARLVQ